MLIVRRLNRLSMQLCRAIKSSYSSSKLPSGYDDEHDIAIGAPNIPGGGLGKLHNTREEVYFCKQQNDLIMKLLKKYQDSEAVGNVSRYEKEEEKKVFDNYFNVCIYGSPSKSVDVHEEGYFYNEQIDLLNKLKRTRDKDPA